MLDPHVASDHSHSVHFYADDADLELHVAKHIQRGIAAGETVLTIATKGHREGFSHHLRAAFPDVPGTINLLSSYRALDADAVLSRFLIDCRPDRSRFFRTMDDILSGPMREGRSIRVYGEMVTRLWQAGAPQAALELETLWNELALKYTFSLLCAYPLRVFTDQDSQLFLATCAAHSQLSLPQAPATR